MGRSMKDKMLNDLASEDRAVRFFDHGSGKTREVSVETGYWASNERGDSSFVALHSYPIQSLYFARAQGLIKPLTVGLPLYDYYALVHKGV